MKANNVIKGMVASLLTVILMSTVACSEGKNKKRVAVTPGVNTATGPTGSLHTVCHDCNESQIIGAGVGGSENLDQYQIRLNAFLVNDSNQVAVDGGLDIRNLSSLGNCGFIPGRYRVATSNAEFGQLSNVGSVHNVGIEAFMGNEVIKMKITRLSFDGFSRTFKKGCDGREYPDTVNAEIVIESVNGKACQGFITKKLYPYGNANFNCSL